MTVAGQQLSLKTPQRKEIKKQTVKIFTQSQRSLEILHTIAVPGIACLLHGVRTRLAWGMVCPH